MSEWYFYTDSDFLDYLKDKTGATPVKVHNILGVMIMLVDLPSSVYMKIRDDYIKEKHPKYDFMAGYVESLDHAR